MHIYTYTCRIHIDAMIKTSDTVLKKNIPLTLFERVVCVRGSWRPNRTAIFWPQRLWPSALCLSCSPDPQPKARGPSFLLAFSTTSCHQRVTKTQSGVPKAPSAGWWLSLPYLSDFSDLQLTGFLSSPSYIIVQSTTQSLEWHVWSSSSGNNCHAVHRSLSSGASVYESTMGFYLVPYRQPSPPTRFLLIIAIGMCHFLPVHHFGMAFLAGSKVNIQHYHYVLLNYHYVLLNNHYVFLNYQYVLLNCHYSYCACCT